MSLLLCIFQGLVFSSCPVQMENRSVSCLTALSGASPPAEPCMAYDLLCQVKTHTHTHTYINTHTNCKQNQIAEKYMLK